MTGGNGLVQLTAKDFKSDQEVRWCPGCGDYAILAGVQSFLPELGIPRENLVFVSGIGCAARFPYYVQTYGMHSIHGRAPAIATGLATSRPDLSVWVVTGDGDALSIGGNHLIHALRRNVDVTILLFNNRIYGLTKGQYSPTSERGKVTKSTPLGSVDQPFNPLSIAIGAEATFVARAIDTDKQGTAEVLRAAAAHRGAAFVEILQNCNIYNDGAFDVVREEKENRLYLKAGEEIRWGDKGVRMRPDGTLEIVDASVGGLLRHDPARDDPGLAFALARLTWETAGGVPLGVFRAVGGPSTRTSSTSRSGERRAEGRGRPRSAPARLGHLDDRLTQVSGGRAGRAARRARRRPVAPRRGRGPKRPSASRSGAGAPSDLGDPGRRPTITPRASPDPGGAREPVALEHVDVPRRRRVGRAERVGERAEPHRAVVGERHERHRLERREVPGSGSPAAAAGVERGEQPLDRPRDAPRVGGRRAHPASTASFGATSSPHRRHEHGDHGRDPCGDGREHERAHVGALRRDAGAVDRRRGQDGGADLGADDGADRPHHGVDARRDAGLGRVDRLRDQRRHRGEREADAEAQPGHRGDDLPRLGVERGEPEGRDGDQAHADRERPLRADATPEDPGRGPREEHQQRSRQQIEARCRRGGAEPVVDLIGDRAGSPPGASTKRGTSTNDPNIAKPEMSAVTFVRSTGRSASTRMSISGSSTRSSSTTQSTAPTAENANSPRVAADVQPQLSPSESASRKVTRTTDKEHGAGHVDPRGRAHGGLGHEPVDEDDRDRDADGADDEEPAPAGVVDDEPGEHEPEPAADAEDGRQEPDPDLHAFGRELVADDPEAQREHRAGRAGHDPEGDERPDVRRDGAADAPERGTPRGRRRAAAPSRTGRRACRGSA